ncbi:MAG TPA: hypothetical protein VGY98_19820 [Verrucomicrobiae bacterium]|jgi:hypothetical protein|nr:hypothetical protein [Verrucomicrobiae bacterium]
MNVKQIAGVMAGIVGLALSVSAQQYNTYNAPETAQPAPPDDENWHHWDHHHLYHACELSVDMYGVGLLHESDFNNGTRARHNLRFGGGAGLNFFFTRYIGIGGDACAITFNHSFVDTTTGNLILRIPIANTGLAPYIFGGVGYQFQGVDQIVGGGGAGLEVRVVPHFSFFVDARYLAAVKTDDFGMGRAGVRLSF